MALSLNANWLREFRREGVQPVFIVSITLDDSPLDVRSAISGPVSFDTTYPACVQEVSPFVSAIDVLERVPEVSEATVVFAGGPTPATSWMRQLVVDYRLKGKKVQILWGTPNLSEADFEEFFAGTLDRVQVRPDSSVEITVKNGLGLLRDAKVAGAWCNMHPVQVVEDVWDRAGLPTALLDTTTLDPASYTTMSHYVIDRCGDVAQHDSVSAFDLIAQVAQTMDGLFVDSEAGQLRFVAYDETKASTADWTDDDIWDLEQEELQGNVITGFLVKFMHGGFGDDEFPKKEYELTDTDAIANYAYPGTSGQPITKDFVTRWLNGRSRLEGVGSSGVDMTPTVPGVGDTFIVYTSRAWAFCGTRWDGFPSGSQDADAQASTTRNLYVKIGSEIIEVDQVTVSTEYVSEYQLEDTGAGVTDTQKVPQLLTLRVKTRGALGTVAAAHDARATQGGAGDLVYDYTIAVKMVQSRLRRFSNGCPIIRFKTALDKWGHQVGDFGTLVTTRYAAYGVDGLGTDTKWEAIGKEANAAEGFIQWTCAWVTGPVAPTPTQAHRTAELLRYAISNRIREMVTRDEVVAPRVISGLTVSVDSGLDIIVAAGVAGTIIDRVELSADVAITLAASKDHWIYFDTETRSVGVTTKATGTVTPRFSATQILLAKGVAGAASVTLTSFSSSNVLRAGLVAAYALHPQLEMKTALNTNSAFQTWSRG